MTPTSLLNAGLFGFAVFQKSVNLYIKRQHFDADPLADKLAYYEEYRREKLKEITHLDPKDPYASRVNKYFERGGEYDQRLDLSNAKETLKKLNNNIAWAEKYSLWSYLTRDRD